MHACVNSQDGQGRCHSSGHSDHSVHSGHSPYDDDVPGAELVRIGQQVVGQRKRQHAAGAADEQQQQQHHTQRARLACMGTAFEVCVCVRMGATSHSGPACNGHA